MSETAVRDGLPEGSRQIAVIGAGYVGMPTAIVLAAGGHSVTVAERDDGRRAALASGTSPMVEDDLEDHVIRLQASNRLRFVASAAEAVDGAQYVFLCVATPTDANGRADLHDIDAAVGEIRDHVSIGAVVVTKSTVPVGTTEHVAKMLDRFDVRVVSNPEFLREGHAVRDSFHPDRVVIGADDETTANEVADLFGQHDTPRVVTDARTAELVKYAANAFLAMKLSFINSMSELCDAIDADVAVLAQGIGLDPRIGPAFLSPGPGWGGSCLPKDVAALATIARDSGVDLPLVDATVGVNLHQIHVVVDRCAELVGSPLDGVTIGVWGLTFKARTGDRRDSPALAVIAELQRRGATVRAYDPTVSARARDEDLAGIEIVDTAASAATGADLLLVLTEWSEFSTIDWTSIPRSRDGAPIFDTRAVIDDWAAMTAGWDVSLLGRRSL